MIQWPGERDQRGYRMVPHQFHSSKRTPWLLWCRICGLVRLKNEITDWCAAHGCWHDEHPGYRQALRRLTSLGEEA